MIRTMIVLAMALAGNGLNQSLPTRINQSLSRAVPRIQGDEKGYISRYVAAYSSPVRKPSTRPRPIAKLTQQERSARLRSESPQQAAPTSDGIQKAPVVSQRSPDAPFKSTAYSSPVGKSSTKSSHIANSPQKQEHLARLGGESPHQAAPTNVAVVSQKPPQVPFKSEDCSTVQQLEQWKHGQMEQILSFVPEGIPKKHAIQNLEANYRKRMADLTHASGSSRPHIQAAALASTKARLPSFEAMLADADGCRNAKELDAWARAITAHVRKFMRPEYQDEAMKDVRSRLAQRQSQLSGSERSFKELLHDADKCQSERELQAWRVSLKSFVETHMPTDMKSFALTDVQRHFDVRISQFHQLHISEARVLGPILADAENCNNEAELRLWRQRAASHIREQVTPAFQIPALGDMQLRFEKRLEILQREASQSDHTAEPSLQASPAAERNKTLAMSVPHSAGRGSVFLMVLLGLGLPAVIAVIGATARARNKRTIMTIGRSTDVHLLET